MADYKLAENGVIRNSDGAFIPNAPGNRDWQAYQDWLNAGNTPDPQYTLAEAQAKAIANIKANANSRIDAFYPIYRQMNINNLQGFVQADKDRMWAYINARRNYSDSREADINAAVDANSALAITWESALKVVDEVVSSQADGSNTTFKLANRPLVNSSGEDATISDVSVLVNGTPATVSFINIGNKWNEDASVVLDVVPAAGDTVLVTYYYKI